MGMEGEQWGRPNMTTSAQGGVGTYHKMRAVRRLHGIERFCVRISDFVDVWYKKIYEGKADVRVRSRPLYAVPSTYSGQQLIMSRDRAQAHVVVEERGLLTNLTPNDHNFSLLFKIPFPSWAQLTLASKKWINCSLTCRLLVAGGGSECEGGQASQPRHHHPPPLHSLPRPGSHQQDHSEPCSKCKKPLLNPNGYGTKCRGKCIASDFEMQEYSWYMYMIAREFYFFPRGQFR